MACGDTPLHVHPSGPRSPSTLAHRRIKTCCHGITASSRCKPTCMGPVAPMGSTTMAKFDLQASWDIPALASLLL